MQYTYDGAGNVLTRTDTQAGASSTVNLGYDNANQLTSEARTGSSAYSASYTYDHNGNRLTKVLGGVTDTYTYDAGDKLLTAGNKSYTYDNNGNCTAVTAGGLTTSLAYDYENRVTQLTYSNSSTNTFTYNAANLRLKKVDSTGTQNYVTDGVSPASPVLQDSGATYTPGISERRGGASKYQHGDLTGNSRALSDSSQAVTDSWVYDGFGMVANRTGTTATPFGYGGGEQYQSDAQSGLALLGNRYYDSSVGRFISRDPAKSGNNWFAYCGNNPLNRSDPSGLAYICDDGDLAAHGKGIAMPFDDGRDWFDHTGDFSCGMANGLSCGLIGNNPFVDQNSGWYTGGHLAGIALQAAITSGAGATFGAAEAGAAGAGAEVVGGSGGGYIPKSPLPSQNVGGVDIPLPDPAAGGTPHTTLGGRMGNDGIYYRQSATFPGQSWPQANGSDVPWSRVDWHDHGRTDHPNPHQHPFQWNRGGGWEQGGPEPFAW